MSATNSKWRLACGHCAVITIVVLAAGGCWSSSDSRLAKAAKDSGVSTRDIFPFAGTVTIDGKPPEAGGTVFVVLNDVLKPQEPVVRRLNAQCNAQGQFEFSPSRTATACLRGPTSSPLRCSKRTAAVTWARIS